MFDFAILKLGDAYGLLPKNDAALNWLILHGAMLTRFKPSELTGIIASIRADGLTIAP